LDKERLHINEAGDNRYPEPDVPVQAAWEHMQQLLLQSPAVPAHTSGFKKWLGKGIGKLVLGAGVAATVSVITVVLIKTREQKTVTPVTHKSDSMVASQPVVASDTLPSVIKEKKGFFQYEDVPLKKVALDIEKTFDIKVILKDDLGGINITTQLDSVTLKEMLKLITVVVNGKYKIDEANKQVTIFRNGADK